MLAFQEVLALGHNQMYSRSISLLLQVLPRVCLSRSGIIVRNGHSRRATSCSVGWNVTTVYWRLDHAQGLTL